MSQSPKVADHVLLDSSVNVGRRQSNLSSILDPGCKAEALIDSKFVRANRLPVFELDQPVVLVTVDDRDVEEHVNAYTEVELTVRQGQLCHSAPVRAYITNLGSNTLILGRPWMNDHDVSLRSVNGHLTFHDKYCLDHHIHYVNSSPARHYDNLSKMSRSLHSDVEGAPSQVDSSRLRRNLERLGVRFHDDSLPTDHRVDVKPAAPSVDRRQGIPEQDFRVLRASAFVAHIERGLKRRRSTPRVHCFASSLYDINKALEKLRKPKDAVDLSKIPDWVDKDLHKTFLPSEADQLPPHRSFDHKIELEEGKQPPWGPLYQMSGGELEVLKEWLEQNLEKGWIRASSSPAAAPVLFAKKPGGGLRLCVDYRGLNEVTKKNRYPIPLVSETIERIRGCKFFTKLDVIAAFNRIRVAEGDEWKTAFRTRRGLFESLVMPFGLANAPPTFQAYINDALREGLDDFVSAYIDDLLIFSKTRKEHRRHVNWVLRRLRDAGLQVDIEKCEFEKDEVPYLGMIIGANGIRTDPAKIECIRLWPNLQSQKDVRSFLGFANFYRKFIKRFAERARPLTELTAKHTPFVWGAEQKAAFEDLKRCFVEAPTLRVFDPDRTCVFESDCSNTSLGCTLSQYDDDGVLHPVAFYSRRLLPPEMNYPIHDKELLAIIAGFQQWRPELSSADPKDPVRVYTDHSSLRYFMSTKRLTQRQVRWSEFLSQFHFQIQYRPGPLNGKADALSRWEADQPDDNDERLAYRDQVLLKPETLCPRVQASIATIRPQDDHFSSVSACVMPSSRLHSNLLFHENRPPMEEVAVFLNSVEDMVDLPFSPEDTNDADDDSTLEELFMAALAKDPLPQQVLNALRNQERQSPFGFITLSECSEQDGNLYVRGRRYVPNCRQLKGRLLHLFHSTPLAGHPGKNKFYASLANEYYWQGMSQDVDTFLRNCHCITSKANRRKPQGLLKPLPPPLRLWMDLSLDFITGLPKSVNLQGQVCQDILVVVDRLSKGAVYVPMVSMDVKSTVDALRDRVIAYHGLPETIISDRGGQFIGDVWKGLMARLGVSSDKSSGYHPQTDGQTENANGVLEAYLRSYVNYHQDDWASMLPEAMLARSSHVAASTGFSPHFLTHGEAPRISFQAPTRLPSTTARHVKIECGKANQWANQMKGAIEEARSAMVVAQSRQEAHANQHRRPHPNYQPGDMVYIHARDLPTRRTNSKLAPRDEGPFTIVEAIGSHAYRVNTKEAGFDWHDVFHASSLYPAANNPFPGQTERLRAPHGDDTWEVKSILDSVEIKRNKYRTDRYYIIDYEGHPPYRTHAWIVMEDLPRAVDEFHERHPARPGPWTFDELRRPKEDEVLTEQYT